MIWDGTERRKTARPFRHGTRWTYQAGCRCRQCRWAEASYRTQLRKLKAKGHRPLGMRVSATQTWRRIRALKIEGFTLAELARRLGLRDPHVQFDTEHVRLRTEQRVEDFYAAIMAEGPEEL